MDEGLPKLWLVHRALELRGEHPEWFGTEAKYLPISAAGVQQERVVAYQRGKDVVTVAPRWSQAAAAWGDTTITLPAGMWRNRLTDQTVQGGAVNIGDLLAQFPVALLSRVHNTDLSS
jgi:(1->4)-alpha-D-glucan 1-alpha-D-glucosylmutase